MKFYNVEELCADRIAEMIKLVPAIKTSRVSIGAFYRLLIPNLITADIEKCIYLDSDMIVNLDIKELWQIDLSDKPLAAVPEEEANFFAYKEYEAERKYLLNVGLVRYEDYFNSGLLVMNLEYLRDNEELIMSGVKWRGDHPQCNCFDQDIWNYLFSKNYIKLPVRFDLFTYVDRRSNEPVRKKIYHFSGASFGMDINDSFTRLWFKYFAKTPWFNEETIGRLYAGVQQMHVGLKNFALQLSAILSGKTRAFFVLPHNVDATKKIFSIHEDEEIILADNQMALQKLIDAMNSSRGKKVFFILVPGFPLQALIQAGFTPGRDFLNGFEFLSEAHGIPLNSYPLIQAM